MTIRKYHHIEQCGKHID